jgi:hypothetical protein
MKKNIGTVDRILRVIVALVVGVLIALKVVSGTLMIVLGLIAIIFLITSAIGFCGLYTLFGISTCKLSDKN